ncbi:MAG: AraC family transcriptional regulator [Sulfurimonas sp. RIFOXYD12_FULL_33_39]|uniref:helix-turn-helix transcriptional regulator n=1 Tax=unclassified Sulfurimonas TaxID=2623549 RepID=UPI0008D40827|nr:MULTISPECIES: AraC family transcriptional regulator [unclassified Sulfurimonas]OHE05397.1 MAG: AraC family transcriptional regulator [Sulfurimonas sp. RIFCSPLOWO2_12_FULL_34_6]OHE09871.1 MAG: AraC family transcriptional regulator [Sulfurimonas sp. RIFOXYD12_FULL_33_39]OHE13621.1 MAG: AraC family transcriptional regulator [Sulfurimonas sp. RIFOXYD2_FULL_34_21]DAB27349.1 MAG TPA: AraC family transcriptional regulator [Sulfurimonas sp. UBA10385]
MDSLFFNITDTKYKVTELLKNRDEYIKRVDISNGVFFLDIHVNKTNIETHFKNLDRFAAICVVKKGDFKLYDNIDKRVFNLNQNSINILLSSKQDLKITTNENEQKDVFILFIADFFLKRYLSGNPNEAIDFLYNFLQENTTCKLINTLSIDALSLYIIDKIINIKPDSLMKSITCEHYILEFIIQRFSLFDIIEDEIEEDEFCISKSAKDILLKNFVNPPSIKLLAHMCATNESKLKKIFKKVYKTTIYGYIQKLRLEKANLLLKEQSLNIGEIAKEVGYKHQGHFSKLFFETYDVYPKDLLKKKP